MAGAGNYTIMVNRIYQWFIFFIHIRLVRILAVDGGVSLQSHANLPLVEVLDS